MMVMMVVVMITCRFLPTSQTLITEARVSMHVDGIVMATAISSLLSQVDKSYGQMVGTIQEKEGKGSLIVHVLYPIIFAK